MKRVFGAFFVAFLVWTFETDEINAQENKFITVVNPVRIAPYTKNVSENLAAQYEITSKLNIPATWLVTYDILGNEDAVVEVLGFDESHEIGVFLEVGEKLASDAGVVISEGSWQFANVVFLSGYIQKERIKLIDTLFEKFKEKFGYYPRSVGSWWTDSYSLNYMYEKYGVIANLTVADQFATDRYQVWGQYWAMPFYPTKYHSAIPASSVENKLPVVMIQWAPRDPINGYYNSLYSTQDYFTGEVGETIDYYKKIMSLYLEPKTAGSQNQHEAGEFGQVTIGLEGDLTPDAYGTFYKEWLELVSEFVDAGTAIAVTMSDFSNWYQSKYPEVSPVHIIHTKDLQNKNREVIWYQSPKYRVGVISDDENKQVKLFDLRVYSDSFYEPYYVWPNQSLNLSINVPSIYDEVSYSDSILKFNDDVFENVSIVEGEAFIKLESGTKINFLNGEIEILDKSDSVIQSIKLDTELVEDTYVFRTLTPEATHLLNSKKFIILSGLIAFAFVYLIYKNKRKRFSIIFILLILALGAYLYTINTRDYSVSQSELDVLRKLKEYPAGRVLVYDNECLQCERFGNTVPAVFANKRLYIEKLTGNRVVFDKAFFREKDLSTAKTLFNELKVDYIYLVSYGGYSEALPVSPGDINVERIYSSANAELWKVKDD